MSMLGTLTALVAFAAEPRGLPMVGRWKSATPIVMPKDSSPTWRSDSLVMRVVNLIR